mmetsp:Transcript_18571/g.49886  ORF Transcript_18571/g.49886 Transcript_18571/m.49886 type:complete len:213 (+) Transcript_18571:218-856(+)
MRAPGLFSRICQWGRQRMLGLATSAGNCCSTERHLGSETNLVPFVLGMKTRMWLSFVAGGDIAFIDSVSWVGLQQLLAFVAHAAEERLDVCRTLMVRPCSRAAQSPLGQTYDTAQLHSWREPMVFSRAIRHHRPLMCVALRRVSQFPFLASSQECSRIAQQCQSRTLGKRRDARVVLLHGSLSEQYFVASVFSKAAPHPPWLTHSTPSPRTR